MTPSLHHEVPSLRTVDSFMQLVDRLIVCRLKQFHFSRDVDKAQETLTARAQAEELSEAAMLYLAECVDRHREPRVHEHLRYHRHEAERTETRSLGEAIAGLTACHARYWEAQGQVMALRKRLNGAGPTGYEDAYRELHEWQLVCDGCNQRRSALVNAGDQMLREMLRRRAGTVTCSASGCDWPATGFIDCGRAPVCERHAK